MSKKAPYDVTDVDALQAAYPQLVKDVPTIVKEINHAKLYAIVKAKIVLEEALPPGVVLRQKKSAAGEEAPREIAQLGVTQVQ